MMPTLRIPFTLKDPEQVAQRNGILIELERAVADEDYFEIGPSSAKLLYETLEKLVEWWGG